MYIFSALDHLPSTIIRVENQDVPLLDLISREEDLKLFCALSVWFQLTVWVPLLFLWLLNLSYTLAVPFPLSALPSTVFLDMCFSMYLQSLLSPFPARRANTGPEDHFISADACHLPWGLVPWVDLLIWNWSRLDPALCVLYKQSLV